MLDKLFSSAAASPIEAIGNVFDQLFTSDEERAKADAVMQRLSQAPHLLQAEISKIEASHRSVFVAGWRPFIGWVCGMGLAFVFVLNPIIQWVTGDTGPEMPTESMTAMVMALLGLGTLRTVEKANGWSK